MDSGGGQSRNTSTQVGCDSTLKFQLEEKGFRFSPIQQREEINALRGHFSSGSSSLRPQRVLRSKLNQKIMNYPTRAETTINANHELQQSQMKTLKISGSPLRIQNNPVDAAKASLKEPKKTNMKKAVMLKID